MLGATPLAVAASAYLPNAVFSPRLHADGAAAMLPFTHAGAAAAAAAAALCGCAVGPTAFGGVSPSYCIGHATMTPLHGDLLAKYLDYIKQRADAAFHYAATHPSNFLTSFAPEKIGNSVDASPSADFVVVQSDSSHAGSRAGVLCASAFLRPGDVYGPMPQQRSADGQKRNLDAAEPSFQLQPPPPSVTCSSSSSSSEPGGGRNAWMLSVRTTAKAEEANMSALQRSGGIVYFRTTKGVWRGEEIVVLVDDFPAAAAIGGGGGAAAAAAVDDRLDARKADEGFQCDRCGKMFAYKYYRDKHLKYTRCVDKGDRKFPCSLCDRSFEKRDRLRIHVLHVHEKHRPHQCAACGKRFSQSSSLNKHARVHSGERPYKCMFCTKAFTASSILRTHIRQHSGEKPFKCKHCGKAFASHAAHDSHVRRTHKEASLAKKATADCRSGSFSHQSDVDDDGGGATSAAGALDREEDIDVVQ